MKSKLHARRNLIVPLHIFRLLLLEALHLRVSVLVLDVPLCDTFAWIYKPCHETRRSSFNLLKSIDRFLCLWCLYIKHYTKHLTCDHIQIFFTLIITEKMYFFEGFLKHRFTGVYFYCKTLNYQDFRSFDLLVLRATDKVITKNAFVLVELWYLIHLTWHLSLNVT